MDTRTTEYKVLCEVHFLHDYYLIDSSYKSFFAQNKEQQQLLLNRKLQAGKYDMSRNFELLLNKEAMELIKNHKMRLMPSPLGFSIAMEVKSEPQADGSIRYRPAISFTENAELYLGMNIVNPLFSNITSVELHQTDKYIYSFSNTGNHSENTLSKPIPNLDTNQFYRIGDLAQFGGTIQQALEDNQGDFTKWIPVSGSGFVNGADRVLDTTTTFFQDWKLGFSIPKPKPFGVIHLKFQTDNPDFSLITSDGYLVTRRPPGTNRANPKRFELRFLSRWAYWRYTKKEGFLQSEIDAINNRAAAFLEWQGNKAVTRNPRYFAQALTFFGALGDIHLPNGQPESLRQEGGRLFSDIAFNAINAFPK